GRRGRRAHCGHWNAGTSRAESAVAHGAIPGTGAGHQRADKARSEWRIQFQRRRGGRTRPMKRAAHKLWLAACLAACFTASARPQAANSAKPRATQKLSNPLKDLLEDARKAIARQDFEAAIAPLQQVIAQEPSFAYGHFQLAYAFTGLKRWDDA